jgi:gliding motility-associated-like protein
VIPSDVNEYSITYWYAVVFQDPGHIPTHQPRFKAIVYVDSVPTSCATFDYTASASLPGFSHSTVDNTTIFKTWSPVSINLSGNAGKTVTLEFTTADCTEGGHFGYAYIDVNSCDANDIYNDGANFCSGIGSVTATAPSGFQSYTWYLGSVTPANIIGTGPTIVITPPPPSGSLLAIDMVPYPGFGCRDTVYATITINPKPNPSFIVDTSQLCLKNNKFNFTSTSTIDSGTISCVWKFGDGSSAAGNTTSHSYTSPGTYTVKLYVTSGKGCVDSTAKLITILAQPVANFSINTSQHCLTGNSFPLTNQTTLSSGTIAYLWGFGDASPNEVTQNPTHSYVSAGSYIIKLISTSSNGCIDSIQKSVTVDPMPTVNINASPAASFCITDNITVQSNAVPGTGSIVSYNWYKNNLLITGVNTPSLSVNYAANINLQVTDSKGCSATSNTIAASIYPLPTGSITNQPTNNLCDGSSLVLTATGGSTYQWFLNNVAITGANAATYPATQEGVYTVQLISAQNCSNMAANNIAVTLIKRPVADFEYDKYCYGQPTQFSDLSVITNSGPMNWSWNFGDNTSPSNLVNPIHSFSNATYSVTLTITPSICPQFANTKTKKIAMESPNNLRYPTVNAIKNQGLQLTSRIGKSYNWIPSFGLDNPLVANPVFNYTKEQEYKIHINTFAGCNDTDTLLVRIFENKNIYVPKAFTPNHDGVNDELYPFLVGVKQLLYFRVYNRWGQLMYSSIDTNRGWNGKFNGVDQPTEAYTWIAEGICFDGTNLKVSGNTILLR